MSSILTNMSAMTAVQNLAATQQSLADVQNEISTGLKVSSAKDNAAYYSIATNMRTTTGDLSAVTDSLNLGSSVVGTATSALSTVTGILQQMQQKIVAAQQAGVDKTQVQTDIAALQKQLTATINAASFNGVNLLDNSATTPASTDKNSFVSSVTGTGANFTINTIDLKYSDTALTQSGNTGTKAGILDTVTTGTGSTGVSILNLDVSATGASMQALAAQVSSAITAVTTVASNIGSTSNNLALQKTFTSPLSDSITTGIGSLVDADMNEASTRLNALQTQQQLGVQALSVANQNSQLILKLFQG